MELKLAARELKFKGDIAGRTYNTLVEAPNFRLQSLCWECWKVELTRNKPTARTRCYCQFRASSPPWKNLTQGASFFPARTYRIGSSSCTSGPEGVVLSLQDWSGLSKCRVDYTIGLLTWGWKEKLQHVNETDAICCDYRIHRPKMVHRPMAFEE